MDVDRSQKNSPLEQGIVALRAGDRARARALLVAAVRAEPRDPRAWVWLAGALDEPARRRECLERALALDPQNAAARAGLASRESGVGSQESLPLPPTPAPRPPAPNLRPPTSDPRPPTSAPRPPPPGPHLPTPGMTLLLAALGGVGIALAGLAGRGLGAEVGPGALLALAVLIGVPQGLVGLLMGGVLLRIAGRQLGGRGDSRAVRAGLAWAAIPQAVGLAIWIGQLLLLYSDSFGGGRSLAATICWGAHWLLGFASLVLAVVGVAAAHRLSIERAIAAWLLAALIVLGALAFVFSAAASVIALRGG